MQYGGKATDVKNSCFQPILDNMVCNDCILFLYEGKLLGARWEDCGKKSPQMTEKDARMSRVLVS